MFNRPIKLTQNTTISGGTSGLMQKSNVKSFFTHAALDSGIGRKILCDKPEFNDKRVTILQTMIVGDNRLLFELVYEQDI